MVNKQEVVNILTNFSKFWESQEELIGGIAKLEQMNSVKYFWSASIAQTVSLFSTWQLCLCDVKRQIFVVRSVEHMVF